MMFHRFRSSARRGQVLLITVLVVGTIVLMVGVGMAQKGIAEISVGLDARQSLRASALADGCADEALLRLSTDHSYQGGSLSSWDGSCAIVVEGTGAGIRTIDVAANMNAWTRKLTIRAELSGGRISILDWKQDLR